MCELRGSIRNVSLLFRRLVRESLCFNNVIMQAVDTPGLFMTAFSMLLKLFSQLAANVRFATVVGSFLRQSLGAVAHILRKNIKSLTHYLALSLSHSRPLVLMPYCVRLTPPIITLLMSPRVSSSSRFVSLSLCFGVFLSFTFSCHSLTSYLHTLFATFTIRWTGVVFVHKHMWKNNHDHIII